MWGRSTELLQDIRDILRVTQENQKDIIDLREQGIKMQRDMMDYQGKLERNAERAHAADREVLIDLKEYVGEHFVNSSTHGKDLGKIYADLNGLETRLNTEFKHKGQLLAAVWTTATGVIALSAYILLHVKEFGAILGT